MIEKDYYPPMHSAEHILNQTMVRKFNCGRSFNAHIEKKKSKCDYKLAYQPDESEIKNIEDIVNEIIKQELPITERFVTKAEAAKIVEINKLPENAGDTIRIVSIGNYDLCACIGPHVKNTSEIGYFFITTFSHENGILRLRFKTNA